MSERMIWTVFLVSYAVGAICGAVAVLVYGARHLDS